MKNTIYNEINEKDTVRLFRKENGEETDIDDKNSFINKNFILYNRFDKKNNYVKVSDKNKFEIQIGAFKDIYIQIDDEPSQTLLDYIKEKQSFIISFKKSLLKYTNGTFFNTEPLLSSIPIFKKLFEGNSLLNEAKDEKGAIKTGQKNFAPKSVFGATEKIFKNKYKYFLCDDFGTEYADHIGLVENDFPTVAFFIEKGGDSEFSATDFQEVVAQAQKNIGNFILNPNQKSRLENKYSSENYKNNGIDTDISRLRKGDNVQNAIAKWLEISKSPILKKQLFIVVNFITPSKIDEVFDAFESMEKDSKSKKNYSEAKQMLWMIASLHNFCIEHNVELKIICPQKKQM